MKHNNNLSAGWIKAFHEIFLSDLDTAITIQLTNRDCVPSSKFKRSNRDSTKLDRDVADIRCASAVRDLGNGGRAGAVRQRSALLRSLYPARPREPHFTPALAPHHSLLTTGIGTREYVRLRIFWRLIHVTKHSVLLQHHNSSYIRNEMLLRHVCF